MSDIQDLYPAVEKKALMVMRAKKVSPIGRRLRTHRMAKGWTQRELESRSGLSNALISQIETGIVRDPGVETITKLAKALGRDPAWLAFGECRVG